MTDDAAFFSSVRNSIFGGHLTADQVNGINTIVRAWGDHGDGDQRKLAYLLATAYHETAGTMEPVREALGKTDAQSIARLDKAFAAGKLGSVKTPYWRTGFFGRGFVQITHEDNYNKAGKALGFNLSAVPEQALVPEIAADILVKGCMEGWFTGKKLSGYINAGETDFINARRVVNGTDRAVLIAGYANKFEEALQLANRPSVQPASPPPAPEVQPPEPQPVKHGMGIKGWLIVGAAFVAVMVYLIFIKR